MTTNDQPTEKPFLHLDGALQLHHCFPTIQGEGPFAGTPATFVRLAGCNLQCPFCDTDYTSERHTLTVDEMIQAVEACTPTQLRGKGRLIVITGGEPFRQNITPFTLALLRLGYRVQVETNGTLFLSDFPFDRATVVCSPKTGRIHAELAGLVHAFKYVLQRNFVDPSDGLPFATLGQATQTTVAKPPVGSRAEIYLQPLDEQDETKNAGNLQAVLQCCLVFGHRLCLQTHKLCKLE